MRCFITSVSLVFVLSSSGLAAAQSEPPPAAEPQPDKAKTPDKADPQPDKAEPQPGKAKTPDKAEPQPGKAESQPGEAESQPGKAEPQPGKPKSDEAKARTPKEEAGADKPTEAGTEEDDAGAPEAQQLPKEPDDGSGERAASADPSAADAEATEFTHAEPHGEPAEDSLSETDEVVDSEVGIVHAQRSAFGYAGGRVFFRSADDAIRLYPHLWLATDFTFAPGNPDVPSELGGDALHPRLSLRRARFGMSGELFERFAFTATVELGGTPMGRTTFAGDDSVRYAPAGVAGDSLRVADLSISYRFRRWLSMTVGQQNVPFSMANRTRDEVTPLLERNIAIRDFVVPTSKDVGLTLWGDVFSHDMLRYEVGVFTGDGASQSLTDERPDVIGRVTVRPLATLGDRAVLRQTHIGVSARYGERDQDTVSYDVAGISTGQGFSMWQPGYLDSFERVTHIIPSGSQFAVGGEARIPMSLPGGGALDVRGEAYYVSRRTREAVEGFEKTNTERFGVIEGLGWYAQISWWALGDAFASGQPGHYRPVAMPVRDRSTHRRGVEVIAAVAGINARYEGASRSDSVPDSMTPSADITVLQFGGGAQYWYSQNVRAGVNYMGYLAPDAGDLERNLATVPIRDYRDEKGRRGIGELAHEIAMRLAVSF